MTNFLVGPSTPIILADTTDHAPGATAANNLGTRTDQIDLTSVASGAYRQSAKFDFGATWARWWDITAALEWSVAPTAYTDSVLFYIGFSGSATAGQDNPGNLSGTDSAYVGYGAAATDADEMIDQLVLVGELKPSNDATIQTGNCGIFMPRGRYGSLVVANKSSQSFIADAVEMSVRLLPLLDQSA